MHIEVINEECDRPFPLMRFPKFAHECDESFMPDRLVNDCQSMHFAFSIDACNSSNSLECQALLINIYRVSLGVPYLWS